MQKKPFSSRIRPYTPLLALYCACVLIRCLLARSTSNFPTVFIDEFLYYSLGRSIATEGTLLFQGQPALYNYVLYPLVLAPIYLLFGSGTNYYRVIQVWNILLMSLSVFPMYGLCRAMLRERKKAFLATALFMLMPDFILGQFVFSEALVYPLFFTLLYCVYRYLNRRGEIRSAVWIGVLGALLYETKPGTVAPAAVSLLLFAALALKDRKKKELLAPALGVLGMAVTFGALWLLTNQVLAYSGSFFSLYDHQMNDFAGLSYDAFVRNAALYPYYFLLSCGVLPVLVAASRYHTMKKEDRQLMILAVLCLIFMMIGTAWLVNRPERRNILYLRYIAMYMPLPLLFCLVEPDPEKALSDGHPTARTVLLLILAGYTALCTAVWGSTAGIGGQFDNHFLISLSVLFTSHIQGIGNILVFLLCALALYVSVRKMKRRTLNVLCCAVFAAMLVINNVSGYRIIGTNTSTTLAKETRDIQDQIDRKEYVYVYTDINAVCDMGLDINTRQNICKVALYDLFNHFHDSQGVYEPFVPKAEKGMISQRPLPDTDIFILDETAYPLVKFSDKATCTLSSQKSFCTVRFEKGARIIDSIITNVENKTLKTSNTGILAVYKEEWLQQPVKISMKIQSPKAQEMKLVTPKTNSTIPLSEGTYNYEFIFKNPASVYNFSVQDSSIQLLSFDIQPVE